MPKAHYQQVSISDTPYYHCVSCCVRRAFLCGEDNVTGKSYEHLKQWIQERLKHLSETFAIEVYAYSILSNHVLCEAPHNTYIPRFGYDQSRQKVRCSLSAYKHTF